MSLFKILTYILNHPLNRDRKTKSLLRFMKWQVGSRLINRDIVFDWVNNAKMIVRNGDKGITGNIYCGLDDFEDMSFVLHFIDENDLFVDVGANVGAYTILACASKGAHGYAFEPVFTTYSKLMNNILINSLLGRVKCYNLGVGEKEEELFITTNFGPANHIVSKDTGSNETATIKLTTLDKLIVNEKPALLKIDVEGYEKSVLNGAKNILKQESLKAIILELNGSVRRYDVEESEVLEIMHSHNFSPYIYNPCKRDLISLNGKDFIKANTLFIRDKNYVIDRLRSAPSFEINGRKI